MPVSKIKNVILLLLVLMIAFLLLLIVPRFLRQRTQDRTAEAALRTRFVQEEIQLSDAALAETQLLYPLLCAPTDTQTRTAATALLGSGVVQQSDSGRYLTSYLADGGECLFYRSGAFEASFEGRPAAEDLRADADAALASLGFTGTISAPVTRAAAVTVTAVWEIMGTPVPDAALTLTYRDRALCSISGTYLSGTEALFRRSDEKCIACEDALVAFLAARESLGWVGSEVRSTRQCYQPMDSLDAGIALQPVWIIETDTATFRVDGITGKVEHWES